VEVVGVTEQLDTATAEAEPQADAEPRADVEAAAAVARTVDLPLRRADDFDSVVAQCAPELLRLALLLTGDPDRAERLVRSTLAQSYRRWRRVRRRGDPQAHLRRALVRHYVSWGAPHGALHSAGPVRADAPAGAAQPGFTTDAGERDATWDLLEQLTRRQRTVLVLQYYAQMPLSDVADEMGYPEATVAAEAERALEMLGTVVPLSPEVVP
jgi:RNA polymerase sigma factor (sigma-70 family)